MQELIQTINEFSVKLKKGIKLRELSSRDLINGFSGINEDELQSLLKSKELDSFTKKVIGIASNFYALNLTLKKELVSIGQIEKIIYSVNEGIYTKTFIKNLMSENDKNYKGFIKEICKAVNLHKLQAKADGEAIESLNALLDLGISKEGIKAQLALL